MRLSSSSLKSPKLPRSILTWATLLSSSWLLPTLLQAVYAQSLPAPGVVVGVTTGIDASTGQRPARINIDDLYYEAGPQWDLYVQALDMFQRVDMTDVDSYYQITGIHGLPFLPWNGVNQTTGGARSGYCPHGQTTFISWHRPYLALFEQILAGHVRKAAKQYPYETVATYTAAAQTFRIPFWDWAQDATLPDAVISPTISYNSPSGPATMRNPLFTYQFPNFPFKSSQGGFGGSLAQFNQTKRCTLVSGAAAGVSDLDLASSVLDDDSAQLQDKVYAVFTQSTTFEAMATTSNSGASFEEPHNIIHDDIACFSVAGHSGHMGDLNWSGFDPIFMLHHANIDRLYAMWQAINFNDPVFTTTQRGIALFGTAAGPVTADSPLRPFFTASSSDSTYAFHTSRSVESINSFGYTYPEIDDWSLAPADLANTVRAAINNLYGPQADSENTASRKKKRNAASARATADRLAWRLPQSRRKWRRRLADKVADAVGITKTSLSGAVNNIQKKKNHKATTTKAANSLLPTPVRNAPILDKLDYSIEVSVDRSQLPLPCIIELYLVGADPGSGSANGGGYSSKSTKIGSTSILSMPQTGTSYSTTPLRRVLVREATRHRGPAMFNNGEDVLTRLQSLAVVIRTPNGTVVSVTSVPSLKVAIQQRSFTPVSGDDQFPRYGPVTEYPLTPRDLYL
ncbi:hypothetical protein SEPCBS119000_006504 [Sporothrix epigloea]|uniref:Tyrosinase copper-binding domain-containing protein n=1 Tax=Sporothrix epigloea TaxID=1892477 RepID=A0ABP0E3D2_9PEZI